MVFKNILISIVQKRYRFGVDEHPEIEWMTPRQMSSELKVTLAYIRHDSLFFKKVLRDKYYAFIKGEALDLVPGSYFLDFIPALPSISELKKQVMTKVLSLEASKIFGYTLDNLITQAWEREKELLADYQDRLEHAHLLYDVSAPQLRALCNIVALKCRKAEQERETSQTGLEHRRAKALVYEYGKQVRLLEKVIFKKGL
jgi:hypothetical protein